MSWKTKLSVTSGPGCISSDSRMETPKVGTLVALLFDSAHTLCTNHSGSKRRHEPAILALRVLRELAEPNSGRLSGARHTTVQTFHPKSPLRCVAVLTLDSAGGVKDCTTKP